MELKGSRTEANLMAAFAGESQARNKYTFYASKARKEGYEQIAAIFEETARNEKEHAELWFKALHDGGIGTTLENLDLFMNAVSANFDDVQNVSIEAKSLGISYNTMQHADIFSLLVIFGIPLVILGFGMSVWMRRRKA